MLDNGTVGTVAAGIVCLQMVVAVVGIVGIDFVADSFEIGIAVVAGVGNAIVVGIDCYLC